jgi:hypothetical protein
MPLPSLLGRVVLTPDTRRTTEKRVKDRCHWRHLGSHHLRRHPLRRPGSRAGAGIALVAPNATASGDAEMASPLPLTTGLAEMASPLPLTTGLHADADCTAGAHTAAHVSRAAGGADDLTVEDLHAIAKPGLARASVRGDDHIPAAVIAGLGNGRTSRRDPASE